MKFLITGGAGFIGSALIRFLIAETDHSVVNVDKLTYAANLMSLEPDASRWRDIADIAPGQRGRLTLAALPEWPLQLTLQRITPVSTTGKGRNRFRVEARLDAQPKGLRPGMEGVAKVDIERRRLIWIWTHDLVDWIRLQAWAWLP